MVFPKVVTQVVVIVRCLMSYDYFLQIYDLFSNAETLAESSWIKACCS